MQQRREQQRRDKLCVLKPSGLSTLICTIWAGKAPLRGGDPHARGLKVQRKVAEATPGAQGSFPTINDPKNARSSRFEGPKEEQTSSCAALRAMRAGELSLLFPLYNTFVRCTLSAHVV